MNGYASYEMDESSQSALHKHNSDYSKFNAFAFGIDAHWLESGREKSAHQTK